MAWTIRHPVLRILFYGHFWLALGAVAQRWWLDEVGIPIDAKGLLATAFAVVAGYGYLRLVRASEPDPIPSDHIRWVRLHRKPVIALVAVAGILALFLASDEDLVFGPWSLFAVAALAFYLVPLRSPNGRSRGLREVPGLKVVLVALAWTFITCGFSSERPWLYQQEIKIWFGLMQFCYLLALAIAFDIGDLRYDRPGLRTIPQLLGPRGARIAAVVLLIPWLTFLSISLVISYHPIEPGWRAPGWDMGLLLPFFGMVATAVVVAFADVKRPWWYFTILLDGMLILVPLLAWIGAGF